MTTNNSKDNTLRLSIIVPVYNTQKYLDDCIISLLNQDLSEDEYEIIFVNDGSTDNSAQVIEKYMENHPCIRLISQQNAGVSAARNNGIRIAKGEYIGFVDSDDYVSTEMYKEMLNIAETNKSDICACGMCRLRGNGEIHESKMNFRQVYEGDDVRIGLLSRAYASNGYLGSVWDKIFKRRLLIQEVIVFDELMKIGEDFWFVFNCLMHAQRVDFIDKPFYFYRENLESSSYKFHQDRYKWMVELLNRKLRANETLKLSIDYNDFYSDFLYKTSLHIMMLSYLGRRKDAFRIFNDPVFKEAIKYRKKLRFKIRLFHSLNYCKLNRLSYFLYKVFGFFYFKNKKITN